MNQPGWYADPETRGLYLRVFEGADGPSRSWLYRFTSPVSGKRRAMGLGSVEICSLANARQKSLDLRRAIFDGIDPIDQRQEKKLGVKESDLNSITFQEAAKRRIKTKEAEWSNSKHKDQWVSTINTYALPIIGRMRVDQITTSHIVKLLEQEIKKKNGEIEGSFWKVRTETATRLRQRIEVILDWCKAHKYISGDNPARYKEPYATYYLRQARLRKWFTTLLFHIKESVSL